MSRAFPQRPLRLLIADDHSPFRRMMKSFFCTDTIVVTECSEGSEAVRLYQQDHHDWVFLDVKMRPVDGIDAARQITTHDPEARVVMVSLYDDPDLRVAALEAGACGYVLKDNLADLARFIPRDAPSEPVALIPGERPL